jgi:acyl-CoA reductase-like NAD-dependent aldehyde dehydrogenase
MSGMLRTISPVDGRVYVERPLATAGQIDAALSAARKLQRDWRRTSVADRAAMCSRMVDAFVAQRDEIEEEISWQMGRPISQAAGEVAGFEERARHMIEIASASLEDISPEATSGFSRFVRREPLGVVLTVAPWNYPYLTAVNSIVPAILAGNALILRHSAQTPLCAERIAQAFDSADAPPGLFSVLHTSHADTERLIASPGIDFVAFTGSVAAGRSIQRAAVDRFIGVGLELGGKDPAYVRPDAALDHAVENLVDGAFFNSGQSCCGIERIYVHEAVYDDFVEAFANQVQQYQLGDPTDPETNLGPVINTKAADWVRGQVRDAIAAGAHGLIDTSAFARADDDSPYLAPQVLVDVDHSMRVMTEESFGPVVGIEKVSGDDEAVERMNDSDFGLTASVWTRDEPAALTLGNRVETGTWFMNRCDYLDPALAWTGVKDSGRGCTLSSVGFEALTRPKSFHLRVVVPGGD